jgi:hypothetical protein
MRTFPLPALTTHVVEGHIATREVDLADPALRRIELVPSSGRSSAFVAGVESMIAATPD